MYCHHQLSLPQLVMAHALHRIMLSTAEAKKCLFAMVARNPQTDPKDGVYCHIFLMASKEQVQAEWIKERASMDPSNLPLSPLSLPSLSPLSPLSLSSLSSLSPLSGQ